jgi:TolA-binding protein
LRAAAVSKIIVVVTFVSAAMLFVSSVVSRNNIMGREAVADLLKSQICDLQDCMRANASQIANLTGQIADMNDEIVELRFALDKKTAENSKLKKQVLDFGDAFRDLEGELRCLEKSERIFLLVDRLRNPPFPSGDDS